MLALPGSLLWLFLLVYFATAQILDNSTPDHLDIPSQGRDSIVGNYSVIQNNEEEKEEKRTLLGDTEEAKEDNNESEIGANKTRSYSEYPANETSVGRNTRRRPISLRINTSNATQIPQMSQERRNSYLSIAERRKYYNRTRVQPKKSSEFELDHQATTHKFIPSSTETPLVNEIRVVKKPAVKDPTEGITEKTPSNNQRVFVSSRGNDTQIRPQTTRQSVIQSQYQFGQKLNLRKPSSRGQEMQDERMKKKKEKSRMELIMENSTNKLNKNYPTQSTKLIKVEKSLWAGSTTPRGDADHENLVMYSHRNGSVLEKLVEYIPANNSENATLDNNRTSDSHPQHSLNPLPLNNINTTVKGVEQTLDVAHKTSPSSISVSAVPKESASTNDTMHPTTEALNTLKTTTAINAVEKTNTTPLSVRTGKASNYGVTPSAISEQQMSTPLVRAISHPAPTFVQKEGNIKEASQTESKKVVVPSGASGGQNVTKTEDYPLTIELNENNKRVLSEMFQTVTTAEPKRRTKGELTTSQPNSNILPANESTPANEITTSTTTTTTTIPPSVPSTTERTTESLEVIPPDDLPEDHKAQGTRYNTKFYIAPNLNRSQVIKVVEEDGEDEEDLDGSAQTAGAAIYILAAFGLIPLLLALIFGTKFVMRRNQREYECESDAKSDISANESQTKENKKKKGSTDLKKSPSNVTTITLVTATRLPRVQHWENPDKQGNRNWEFPRSKLKLKTILGQGNFGQVWKAEAEDMVGHEGVTRLVAVKTVKEGAAEKEHTEFIKELEIMQQIGSHPNIVTLLGCCTDQEPYYLIMEYVKCGKLLTYLREHRVNENYYNFSNNSDALTSRDLTVFAYCVARGMEYLASRGIIHRDLAARNVLVDQNKLCKIADFGMSRSVRDFENGQVYEERQQKGALPIRWMAPESLVYSVFTYKSDVWSFGIVMWEIVTLGSTPYPNMGAREVMRKVRDGYRLERPSHCNPEFYRLISHCWAHDPNKRPDFSELRQELSCLLDNPTKDGSYVDLDRFAIDNSFHVSSKTNDFRLLERNDFKTLQKLGDWGNKDWSEDVRKMKMKKGKNNGKGTVMLTGQGSFTVNSRILEKEFKII